MPVKSMLRVLVLCSCSSLLSAAESLAPPHAPLVEGLPVAVTAHPQQQVLLNSELPALAANKTLVYNYWREVWLTGNTRLLDRYLAADYVEHNPLLPTGRTAFGDWLVAQRRSGAAPAEIPELVSIVAEGPWVVMTLVSHYPEPDGSGDTDTSTYTSTHFEMFRIAAGRIVEHWDSTLFRAGQQVPDYGENAAVPVRGIAGLAQHALLASEDPQLFSNKRLVFDLWRHVPEGGREEIADLYIDPIYIQHNPNAATGREGAKAYFSRRPDSAIETYLEAPLVAMVAEGDLVVQVLETERVQNGVEYKVPWFDMFRIAGARVIEHWDTASKGELPADMLEL